jgi:hypothetical protein
MASSRCCDRAGRSDSEISGSEGWHFHVAVIGFAVILQPSTTLLHPLQLLSSM